MNNLTTTTKENNSANLFQNPLMKKFAKVKETSESHVTYSGVAKKCGFFTLMILAGVLVTFLTNFLCNVTHTFTGPYPLPIVVIGGIGALLALVTPFIAIFAKKTTPVTGSLFCAGIGMVYSVSAILVNNYRNEILLAMLLTVALFATLTTLFSFGIINVTQKFRSISYIILGTCVVAAILMAVFMFIPGFSGAISVIVANPLWSIAIGLTGVSLASLFILMDLQNVKEAVDNKVPKEYEWDGAFGIIFSVIWLFVEILQILTNAKG